MRKRIIILGIISVIYVCFFPIIRNNVIYNQIDLEIASGYGKNPISLGTEVWIDHIDVDGKTMDLSTIQLADGWNWNGRIYADGSQIVKQRLHFQYLHNISIYFVKHPYSGYARVTVSDKQEDIDLFAESETILEYTISR